ncbi:MAG: MarR family transcriptional regulator [Microscillaceae bacterium]|nr:MarR family transcriptional regulator [Microscillaceae bacterium]
MRIEEEIQQSRFKDEYERAMINVLFTGNWLHNLNNQFLKPFGLTVQQFNVLRILRGQYPQKVMLNVVQARMLDRMSNASRLVDKLMAKELLKREACQSDRRRVDIWITAAGLTLLEEIDEKMENFQAVMQKLSAEEAQQLNLLLDKLRE